MELSERMIQKYPKNFQSCFDFWISKGWESLVEKLIDDVIAIDPKIKIQQIKQKFGGLRFYVERYNKDVDQLIEKAEIESESICEVCGAPGKIVEKNYWLQCVCEEHAK